MRLPGGDGRTATESIDELAGNGARHDDVRLFGMPADPHARFETLDRELVALHEAVVHAEARALPVVDRGDDVHVVAELRWNHEFRAHIDHRKADDVVLLEQRLL